MRRVYAGKPAVWERREEFEDDVHSFFIHCHHIGDWIVALNVLGITAQDVNNFINEHECLKICADLSNGTKHCRLTRKRRTRKQPRVAGAHNEGSEIGNDGSLVILKSSYTVHSSGAIFDALQLAEDCMRAWNVYVEALRVRVEKTLKS